MSAEIFSIIASCISKIFISGSQILRRFHWILPETFPISFTNCLRMVAWTAGKNCGFQVFCSFNNFVSWFDFQNVYVIPHLPNFRFLDSKNKNAINKNFGKNLLHIQKTNTKNFCDTLLLKLKLLESCERPGYWKWCQDIVPNAIIPNVS